MKESNFNDTNLMHSVGYHFSRFRRSGWRALRLWRPGEYVAERKRKLKLMALYYMGVLLMFVGFLICFNAISGNSSNVKPHPATPKSGAGISAEYPPGYGFRTVEGHDD